MEIFRKIKRFFVLLLIPATLVLFFNHETNKHIHVLPNGEIVIHSHPFDKDSPIQHNHTAKEFSLFSQIFNSFSSEAVSVSFAFVITFFIPIKHINLKEEIQQSVFSYKSSRAPPSNNV